MLQDEDQRKAYLHLMTSFIMEAPKREVKKTNSSSNFGIKEKVKYMISSSATGIVEVSPAGTELFDRLTPNMAESEVLKVSDHICLERGYVLISDMRKRLYMHLDKNVQIWVELTQDGINQEAVITKKSNIEAKSVWKVYRNNILKVSPE